MKEVDKKAAKDNEIKNKKITNSLPMDIDDDFERITYNDNNKQNLGFKFQVLQGKIWEVY